jgi:hypothetical protein
VEEKAKQDLPGLKEWVKRLLDLAKQMTARIENVPYFEGDHLGFLALCFLSKQIDHLQSIEILIPRRDAILIARSMIEGLCQLLWIAEEPNTRALQWRAFVYVHDWRLMQNNLQSGKPVDPKKRANIEYALQQHGAQFLTEKARNVQREQRSLPSDPYHKSWRCGKPILNMCKAVGVEPLYRVLYHPYSDWQHWGPSAFGRAISREEDQVIYSQQLKPTQLASVLAVGFQCLFQTAQLTDSHIEIGLEPKLSKLQDEYVEWHMKESATNKVSS